MLEVLFLTRKKRSKEAKKLHMIDVGAGVRGWILLLGWVGRYEGMKTGRQEGGKEGR